MMNVVRPRMSRAGYNDGSLSGAAADTDLPSRADPISTNAEREKRDRIALGAHVGALIALGLAARLLAARRAVLMPDELWHLRVADARSLFGVYRASLDTAHPPLFMVLLHFWRPLARSEWQLRLLPVAFGAAFLLSAYRWVRFAFGEAASLAALALLSFLPSLVLLSTELRAYGLMLWLLAASLGALERAFEGESIRALGLSAIWAGLALLTHYSALWVVTSAFVYAAVRIRSEFRPASFRRAWLGSQAALAALCLVLYVTHVAKLRGGALEQDAQSRWLHDSYFQGGDTSPLRFAARQTLSLFAHVFSTPAAGAAALLLFLTALVWLAREDRPMALLLVLPFLVNLGVGLAGLYPYGGTRHSIFLGLFACAGAGTALARVTRDRRWVSVGLALLLAPAGFAAGG